MKEADIYRFIEEKESWIGRKQIQALNEMRPSHQYVDGELFLYLGHKIPLRIIPSQKPALVMDGTFSLTESAQPQARSYFANWYREQARSVLTERTAYFARNHGFKPGKLRISSAKMRWGSCSARGTLSFTWRLVMAPLEVVDYVVVHELCHLKELNHSRAFWMRVETILPDYKQKRKWLKDNGKSLVL
jgi:hypothetical protein